MVTPFWQSIEQFNQREFYACHDTLEDLWLDAAEVDRGFYQGILQIAVACYHLGNNNGRGAVILLGEGIQRLQPYQPDYQGIDVARLIGESELLLSALQPLDREQVQEFVRQLQMTPAENSQLYPRLPTIVAVSS